MEKQDQIIIYKAKDGQATLEVNLQDETVWLTQKQMALLFGKNIMTINEHIRNVYEEGELKKRPTIRKSLIVQKEGKRQVSREIEHYNLDVIISVGYRVKSQRGTQFRIWANKILREYLVRGFVVNEKKLSQKVEQFNELKKIIALGFWKRMAYCLQKPGLNVYQTELL